MTAELYHPGVDFRMTLSGPRNLQWLANESLRDGTGRLLSGAPREIRGRCMLSPDTLLRRRKRNVCSSDLIFGSYIFSCLPP